MKAIFFKRCVFFICILSINSGVERTVRARDSRNNPLESKMMENLNKSKELLQRKQTNYLSAYKKLIAEENQAFVEGPFSVMDKKLIPPSGDKHDYLGLAPYFWPDPSAGIFSLVITSNARGIYQLFTISGALLKESHFTGSFKIEISDDSCNIYFLKLRTGSDMIIKKLIVIN